MFKAIKTLPQPTAFSALVKGYEGECPCCRRPFADASQTRAMWPTHAGWRSVVPGKRMVIATGSPEPPPSNISEVLHPDLCIYVHKESGDAAKRVLAFLKGLPDKVRWSERLLRYLVLKPNFCGLGVDLGLVLETLARWARNAARSSASTRESSLLSKEDRFVTSGDDNGSVKCHPLPGSDPT